MVARIGTVAFQGIDVLDVDVQVQTSPGLPSFTVVGLPDKAVAESRERVRAALHAMGLALPAKRITVNLAPADLVKEGSHFDLPIALGLLSAMDVLDADVLATFVALGELALDGAIMPVAGVLPAALHAGNTSRGLICPQAQGGEAAWAGETELLAPISLLALINHFKGSQVLTPPRASTLPSADQDANALPRSTSLLDLADIKGQETAKRALEIAAAGGHNLLMVGPPGAGKSMMAQRLPGLLPKLTAEEILEISMVRSLAGDIQQGALTPNRPFRDPHHSASLASLIGGGLKTKPGEVSLAHLGVLFLDELPEFQRSVLEALRQPMETGRASIARANAHVTYPARFQLIAAMNPCRCGYLGDPLEACSKAPKCGEDYQSKISGPLYDRIDLHVDVPAVSAADLTLPPPKETSTAVAERVNAARTQQRNRFSACAGQKDTPRINAEADGRLLEEIARPNPDAQKLLTDAATRLNLSARGYHRVLRVARTIADLDQGHDPKADLNRVHIAEALSFRRVPPGRAGRIKMAKV